MRNKQSWGLGGSLGAVLTLLSEGAHLTAQVAHGRGGDPLGELSGSVVLDGTDEDVLGVAAGVQTLSVEIRDSAALQGDDLPRRVPMSFSHGAPESDADADIALVSDSEAALVFSLAVLEVD